MCGSELLALPGGVQRVASVLLANGHDHAPVMLDGAARTAQQAADALGVAVGQIAKSIIFRRKPDDAAVLVVTSGDRRVDEEKVEALVCPDGQRLGRANAEFVKARTGFSIGGVAPLAHACSPVMLIDASLFRFDVVWAAAGHPHAVFQLSPQQLQAMTSAPVADVAVDEDEKKRALDHAISLVQFRAQGLDDAAGVPSPCISICRMNSRTDLCDGCFRTGGEIASWSGADDAAKRSLWAAILQRMAGLRS